jgi:hypothetical protein
MAMTLVHPRAAFQPWKAPVAADPVRGSCRSSTITAGRQATPWIRRPVVVLNQFSPTPRTRLQRAAKARPWIRWGHDVWVSYSGGGAGGSLVNTTSLGTNSATNPKEAVMVGEKVEHFQGKGTELSALQSHIEEYLKTDGFTAQTSVPSTQGVVIQAKKGGFLRGVIAADRALTIMIAGTPQDFTVRIGIGKWLEHLAVAAVETLLISDLFLIVDVAEMAWNIEIEDKLVKDIKSFVG